MKPLFISIALLVCISACNSFGRDPTRPVDLNIIEEPSRLPYRFMGAGCTNSWHYPINLDTSGTPGLYIVQNDWREEADLSSIVFKWEDKRRDNTIAQFNAHTDLIISHYPADLDSDGIEELAVTYLSGDTVWLEVLEAFEEKTRRYLIEVGEDSDQSGTWDGTVFICNDFDINGDGFKEIFFNICAGYDESPRYLACFDWKAESMAWKFDIPAFISFDDTHIIKDKQSGEHVLVFGAGSHCNDVQANDMDDCHSYLLCMSLDGRLLWKREMGGRYTHVHPEVMDYKNDGTLEIISELYLGPDDQDLKDLIAVDIQGNIIDTLTFEKNIRDMQMLDIDFEGSKELCIYFSDNTIDFYNSQLELELSLHCNASLTFAGSYDFIGHGNPQFISNVRGVGVTVLGSEFEQLAFLGIDGGIELFKSDSMIANIFVRHPIGGCSYNIVEAPWHSLFARHPILAFLGGFIPLAIILIIIWIVLLKFRQKNKTISRQRDSLDNTLNELKETQEKLIEAEKFKLAKDMAGGFAHEIRNALFPARASIKRIEMESNKEKQKDSSIPNLTTHANNAIRKAVDLTNLITEYTRMDSIRDPERVNINSVMNEVLETNELRLKDKAVEINIEGSDQVYIESNRRQFFSVINNLLLNSIDAMKENSERIIDVSWSKNDSFVNLRFHDNGVGIPREQQDSIFNAFRSYRKEKGIGLGLAIVKRIVEMYDGLIAVESDPPNGTTFDLKLKNMN
ncbi:MAG: GHKL domain-containing protein [candidate division Zixibacteria bacterium]|nr:GHKL domain-containing protein [candidate division Zixibacteria bacterium]